VALARLIKAAYPSTGTARRSYKIGTVSAEPKNKYDTSLQLKWEDEIFWRIGEIQSE